MESKVGTTEKNTISNEIIEGLILIKWVAENETSKLLFKNNKMFFRIIYLASITTKSWICPVLINTVAVIKIGAIKTVEVPKKTEI